MATQIRVDQRVTMTQPGLLIPFPAPADPEPAPGAIVVEPSTPPVIVLGAIPSPDLRLRKPIRLEVQREEGEVGVWSEDLEEFGYGSYLTAAIEDFQQTIIELYHTLEDEQDRLGPGMVELWNRLQLFLEHRP